MINIIRRVINKIGYDVIKQNNNKRTSQLNFPSDFSPKAINIIKKTIDHTMTSPERMEALIHAVDYVVDNRIEGDIVECGVWRGGSMMATALALIEKQSLEKELYLFDTYEGMPAATDADISITGERAVEIQAITPQWVYAPLEIVKDAMLSTGYPAKKINYVKGMVENTIPKNAPSKICLLRLDTDWYESTRHELIHLFPRLVVGGVLIVDDYGHWQGAKKAVDEYIRENNVKILLNRIDYTGRIAIKQ